MVRRNRFGLRDGGLSARLPLSQRRHSRMIKKSLERETLAQQCRRWRREANRCSSAVVDSTVKVNQDPTAEVSYGKKTRLARPTAFMRPR